MTKVMGIQPIMDKEAKEKIKQLASGKQI